MRKLVLISFLLVFAHSGFSQNDSLVKKLDSLSQQPNKPSSKDNEIDPSAYNKNTTFTIPGFVTLQWSNLKQSFTKPFHMSGHDWGLVAKFALLTGALALADESIQRFALDLRNHNSSLRTIGRQVTNFGGPYEGYTLGAFGAYGLLFNNKKMQTVTLLAVQSYLTGAGVQYVLKFLSGRQRPYVTDSVHTEADPVFHGPFAKLRDAEGNRYNGSFPSGHTTVAFAAATVFALEYRDKPWVPVFCYTAASLIGLSRITENRHWATDVIAGGAVGYLVGRQVVNNYHRFVRLKTSKNPVSFSLDCRYGQLVPEITYRF